GWSPRTHTRRTRRTSGPGKTGRPTARNLQAPPLLALGFLGRRREVGGAAAQRVLDLFLRDELEQHRLAVKRLLHAALDRRDDLRRVGDALAVATQGLGEVGVVAGDVGGVELLR